MTPPRVCISPRAPSEPAQPARARATPARLLRALRAFSLPVSVLPVLVATAAVLPVQRWRWDVLGASAAGAGLMHLVGNLLNDYFDFRKGVDRQLHDDNGRPGRLLVRGQLLPRHLLAEAAVALGLGAAAAAHVAWRSGPGVLWFAIASVAGAYAYTGPPLHLKYRRLGEVSIFVVFGPLLMLGAAYAQTGRLEWTALRLSVPVGLMTTSILVANNFRDRAEDALAGIRTLGQVADGRLSRALYVVLGLAASSWLAALGAMGLGPRALLAAPLGLLLLAGPLKAMIVGRRSPDIDARTARFETAMLVFVLAAYVLSDL